MSKAMAVRASGMASQRELCPPPGYAPGRCCGGSCQAHRRANRAGRDARRTWLARIAAAAILWFAGLTPARAYETLASDVRALFEGANWDQPETVELRLDDHRYTPDHVRLRLGVPYVLRLKNVGATSHDMIGGSFFGAIVLKMVRSQAGHVVTPRVRSIYVRPKQDVELWLLPVKRGEFSFHCSISGHQEAGMEGTVAIE